MNRLFLAALLWLAAATRLQAQLSLPELEDASDFARRVAKAAIAGPQRVFVEILDVDRILERRLEAANWSGLTERQRDQLRAVIREHFLQSLSPTRAAAPGEIVWSWAAASSSTSDGADVMLGLKFGDRSLKTRWLVRRARGGWHIADVVLSDPGISLAEASVRALGPEPVRRRHRRQEAEQAALPRLAALAVIALLLVLVAPRLARGKRLLLILTAAAPAVLFTIDGVLAVQRTLGEPYALGQAPGRAPWRESERQALEAEREGRVAEARRYWVQAIAQGDPAGPIEYQMGLSSRQRGDLENARAAFERALAERSPAPGAAKELAAMDAAQGKYEEAGRRLDRYLAVAGPDPESLSMLAVIQTNLGKTDEALRAIQQARALVGDGWRGAELEAQVRARAGDAAGAVAALRPLAAEGRLDRSTLRADPAYAVIATDPMWVSFLNEKPNKK
jgi:tetratricopeptide (TPR) repeat protein